MSAGLNPVIIGSKRACSCWRQRAIHARDVGVGERVVVERRVAVQVVGRREVAGVRVRPLLLQRDAEQRRSADPGPHDLQELADVDALLDVVRQVEVRVVEAVARGGRCLACQRNAMRNHQDRNEEHGTGHEDGAASTKMEHGLPRLFKGTVAGPMPRSTRAQELNLTSGIDRAALRRHPFTAGPAYEPVECLRNLVVRVLRWCARHRPTSKVMLGRIETYVSGHPLRPRGPY